MADLFTRLVSGPVSAVPLAPRVPGRHEPTEASNVYDVDRVLASLDPAPARSPSSSLSPSSSPSLPQAHAAPRSPSPRWQVEAVRRREPRPHEQPSPVVSFESAPLESVPVEAVSDERASFETVSLEASPVEVARDGVIVRRAPGEPVVRTESGRPGGLWSSQRPQTSKISPHLRPREPGSALPRQAPPEPARTTVRIEIGRIEIRAPQQPVVLPLPARPLAPQGQQQQGQQGLSLADYLRGNDGRPR